MFLITNSPIDSYSYLQKFQNPQNGAVVSFEGRVRNINQGFEVLSLEYEIYHDMALREGDKILHEARRKFKLNYAIAIHREGHLKIEDIAVLIITSSIHRDEAYKASRYIIDQIKLRLPVWKKEHYSQKEPDWVFCKDHLHHQNICKNDFYKHQQSIINQDLLARKKVFVIGAGGLGCPVLISLTQAGVGELHIIDHDKVSVSNLHRQSLYSSNLIGEKKAEIAKYKLQEINPFIKINSVVEKITPSNISSLLSNSDCIVDCTDNSETKLLLEQFCILKKIPLVSGSVFKSDAIIRTFDSNQNFGCSRCFNNSAVSDYWIGNCNDYGISGFTVNTIGSLMASEVVQFLEKNENTSLRNTLLIHLNSLEIIKIRNSKNLNCKICNGECQNLSFSKALEIDANDMNHDSILLDIRNLSDEMIEKLIANEKHYTLACHKGIRSKALAKKLNEKGFKNILSLSGGLC